MARVTTRAGDDGYTRILSPGRLPKEHPRIEALGALDEATSALGLARAQSPTPRVVEVVLRLQHGLYLLMGELAGAGTAIGPTQVAALEALAGDLKSEVEIPSVFIIPGATVSSAALDVARTVVRRAERVVARLVHEGELDNPELLRYLNRCSDLLHVLARYDEVSQGVDLQTQG
jgi:cob(I)alamin adenosyltransferase